MRGGLVGRWFPDRGLRVVGCLHVSGCLRVGRGFRQTSSTELSWFRQPSRLDGPSIERHISLAWSHDLDVRLVFRHCPGLWSHELGPERDSVVRLLPKDTPGDGDGGAESERGSHARAVPALAIAPELDALGQALERGGLVEPSRVLAIASLEQGTELGVFTQPFGLLHVLGLLGHGSTSVSPSA